uniref:Uncharacterized protein n=1 Tax=Rhipicephalus zambeziensis TaxID=60191 RepID=A0A224Y7M3_9ACAR
MTSRPCSSGPSPHGVNTLDARNRGTRIGTWVCFCPELPYGHAGIPVFSDCSSLVLSSWKCDDSMPVRDDLTKAWGILCCTLDVMVVCPGKRGTVRWAVISLGIV